MESHLQRTWALRSGLALLMTLLCTAMASGRAVDDVANHTWRFTTVVPAGLAPNDMHLLFTGTGGTIRVTEVVPAAMVAVSPNGNDIDVTWSDKLAPGTAVRVTFTTQFRDVAFNSGNWTNDGVDIGEVTGELEEVFCITGFVGDMTIAGGWTAFETASDKTMEVLVSGVADFTSVSTIPSSLGNVGLTPAHEKRTVGASWGSWSHGYTGEMFWTVGATSSTITMPDDTTAFDLYIEPNPFAVHVFDLTGFCDSGGSVNIQVTADGSSGASHGGFYTASGETLDRIEISGPVDYAIGELRISGDDEGGLGEKYCQANPNSCGSPASIAAVDQGDGTFLLSSSPVPAQPGIFFHGPNQIRVPFGNGFLCAGGDIIRLLPPIFPDADCGKASVKQNFADYAGMGKRNFQFWYRDPAGGGDSFNTSNAVSITFP